jgi:hypothetical protein
VNVNAAPPENQVGAGRALVAVVHVRHWARRETSDRLVRVPHHYEVGVVLNREPLREPREVRAAEVIRHRRARCVRAPFLDPAHEQRRVERLRLGDAALLPVRQDDRFVLGNPASWANSSSRIPEMRSCSPLMTAFTFVAKSGSVRRMIVVL